MYILKTVKVKMGRKALQRYMCINKLKCEIMQRRARKQPYPEDQEGQLAWEKRNGLLKGQYDTHKAVHKATGGLKCSPVGSKKVRAPYNLTVQKL